MRSINVNEPGQQVVQYTDGFKQYDYISPPLQGTMCWLVSLLGADSASHLIYKELLVMASNPNKVDEMQDKIFRIWLDDY